MGAYARERAVDHISSLARRGLDLRGFWDASAEGVSEVVGHYMAPCWFPLAPASLLVTSHYDHGQIPELPAEWMAQEYYEDDVHDMAGGGPPPGRPLPPPWGDGGGPPRGGG